MSAEINVSSTGAVSFVGADAVNLYRCITLRQALRMYATHKMIPTRGVTPTAMLRMSKEYTGKTYKRGEYLRAADDLTVWIDTMKAALPVTHR